LGYINLSIKILYLTSFVPKLKPFGHESEVDVFHDVVTAADVGCKRLRKDDDELSLLLNCLVNMNSVSL